VGDEKLIIIGVAVRGIKGLSVSRSVCLFVVLSPAKTAEPMEMPSECGFGSAQEIKLSCGFTSH